MQNCVKFIMQYKFWKNIMCEQSYAIFCNNFRPFFGIKDSKNGKFWNHFCLHCLLNNVTNHSHKLYGVIGLCVLDCSTSTNDIKPASTILAIYTLPFDFITKWKKFIEDTGCGVNIKFTLEWKVIVIDFEWIRFEKSCSKHCQWG